MASQGNLEKSLGFFFRNKHLLRQALTHSSYLNENPDFAPDHNQRLEYLGDAVLDFLVADLLYQRFPDMREGELTRLRAVLVKTETLAQLALSLDLGRFLYLGRGEEERGGRERSSILEQALESLLAAIYLDQGLEKARTFIIRLIEPRLEIALAQEGKDYKSILQERAQALFQKIPNYRTLAERGPNHEKEFEVEVTVGERVLGRGMGNSKQAAEQEAAQQALESL